MVALSHPGVGPNGTTVDATNSALTGDTVTPVIGTNATLIYSNAQTIHQGTAFAITTGASAVNCNLPWTLPAAAATIYFRGYLRTPSSFAVAPTIGRVLSGGSLGTQAARFAWNASGNVLIRDSGNTLRATSTNTMSVSTWYRFEGFVTQGATGTAEIKFWTGANLESTGAPTETLTATPFNFGTVNVDTMTWGQVAGLASVPTWYLADTWLTDFGYVGPTSQPDTTFVLPLPPWALLTRPILPWYWSRSSLVDAPTGPPGPVPFSLVQSVPGRAAVIPAPAQFIHPPLGGAAPSGPVPFALAVPLRGYGRAAVIPKPGQFIHPPLGSPAIGQPFLPGTLNGRIAVEIAWAADLTDASGTSWAWTEVTGDVMYDQRVSITQGRADETSQASPAACSFVLLNQGSAYSPYTPASANYPYVRRNTPVRVRVDPGDGVPRTRFEGYAVGFNPAWDPTASVATVAVTANGILRRLTQGRTPLRSSLYRAITAGGPVAYWPLDDGSGATSAANAVSNNPLIPTAGTPTFGVTSDLAGTPAIVELAEDAELSATMTAATSTSFLGVDLWFKLTPRPGVVTTAQLCVVTFNAGGIRNLIIGGYNTAGSSYAVLVTADDSTGATWSIDSTPDGPDPYDGLWHHVYSTFTLSGSDTSWELFVDGVSCGVNLIAGFTFGTVHQPVLTNLQDPGAPSVWFGGLAFQDDPAASSSYAAGPAYAGEDAATRLARLAAEQGVPITVTGTSSTLMGAQPSATFVDLLRECETADGGLLYDGLGPGLGYICRSVRYNAAASMTLDMATDPPQVASPFTPVDDDQRNRNDVTASRTGGSSARFVDQTGPLGTDTIGTYDTSVTVNVQSDDQLLDQASWLAHLGTVEGLRYPTLPLDLLAVPAKAVTWLAVPLVGRVDVVNVTSRALQHPPDDLELAVEGWNETLGTFTWQVVQNCSSQLPWRVAELEDTDHPLVLDTDGSTLAVGVDTTATSWSVSSTGALWTTLLAYPADFPMEWNVDGERVRVTDLTGGVSPQTATVVRSVNGVVAAHAAGTDIRLWDPAVLAL